MRIAVIINGGVNVGYNLEGVPVLSRFLRLLAEKNDVVIFSIQPAEPTSTPYHLISCRGGKYIKYIDLIYNFIKHHRKNPFDIIQSFYGFPAGIMASLLGKMTNIPTLLTLMGGESANVPESEFGMLRKQRLRLIIFWGINNSSKVIALSHYQLEILRRNGLKRKDIEIIPFGVNKQVAKSLVSIKREEPFRLISIAYINPVKDHFTLVRMFKELLRHCPAKLTILGEDFYAGQIHAFVKEQGIEDWVEFVGEKTNKEVLDYLKDSHLHIISSRSESLCMAFIEAMSVGIPTCGTNVGLMSDLSGSHCLTSPVGNHEELAKNALRLLTDENIRENIIQSGLAWVRDNSPQSVMTKYTSLYKSLSFTSSFQEEV
ncbi:MAG: glycosyltransferase family 4 protein [Cytophagia bacterium]|nr:glycosyltransferase family 4 protein [Cytophagia bacterium]